MRGEQASTPDSTTARQAPVVKRVVFSLMFFSEIASFLRDVGF